MTFHKDFLKKWEKYCEEIYKETKDLYAYDRIEWEYSDIMKKYPELYIQDLDVYSWKGYAFFTSIRIRRLTDDDRNCHSLIRLMRAIVDYNKNLGPSKMFINPDEANDDIKMLQKKCEKIVEFVNNYVAHSSSEEHQLPLFSDLRESIRILKSMVDKYVSLVLNRDLDWELFYYDWKDLFESYGKIAEKMKKNKMN